MTPKYETLTNHDLANAVLTKVYLVRPFARGKYEVVCYQVGGFIVDDNGIFPYEAVTDLDIVADPVDDMYQLGKDVFFTLAEAEEEADFRTVGDERMVKCPVCGSAARVKYCGEGRYKPVCINPEGCILADCRYFCDSEEESVEDWNSKAKLRSVKQEQEQEQ